MTLGIVRVDIDPVWMPKQLVMLLPRLDELSIAIDDQQDVTVSQ